jgi:hypothetical protein
MRNPTQILFIAIDCLLCACTSHREVNNKKLEGKISDFPLGNLKKYTFCRFLQSSLPLSSSVVKEDGSLSMYVQIDSASIDIYELVDEFTLSYLKNNKLKSATDSNLRIAQCFQLYESDTLESFLRKLVVSTTD